MKSILTILALAFLAACSPHKTEEPGLQQNLDQLRFQKALYEGEIKKLILNQDGWLSKGCDALLFSSLFAASSSDSGASFDASKAEDANGHWQRRNVDFGPCYPKDASTTISKDMLLGLTFWAWRAKQLDTLLRLVDYGNAHNWVMGEPTDPAALGKVVITPALAGLIYQVIYKLGGSDHQARHLPDVYPSGMTGFEAHLQVVDILLHAEVDDQPGVSDAAMQRLRDQAARQPSNPFFAVALAVYSGDSSQATKLLQDQSQWPADKLPTEVNHCKGWVIESDDGDDWKPCTDPDASTTYGGDFVFMADLLLRAKQ